MKIALLFCCIALSQATENLHDEMYKTLTETAPCVLRLNGSQVFGCTSRRGGSIGVVHLAYNQSSLDWVLNNSTTDGYIVVLNVPMFTMANLKRLNSSHNVNGVLLAQKETRSQIESFSPESKCPNKYSGLANAAHNYSSNVCPASSPWNTAGNEIAMQYWHIPMFFTDDKSTIDVVEECFQELNLPLSNQADRVLCALELSSYMFASGDSNKCLRRSYPRYNINPVRFCDPLADSNVYAPVIPFEKFNKVKNESYILVTARLDSTSLFLGRATGALSTATSIAALLLTSNVLSRLIQENNSTATKNVLFLLFNGEAYDYLGSQRVVDDILRGDFPYPEAALHMEDVGLFLELSQLVNNNKDGGLLTYHTYTNLTSAEVPIVGEFDSEFKRSNKKFNYSLYATEKASENSRFPPSSYQSFLTRQAVPGFVLASYNNQFQNNFYHSMYDDASNLDYKFANDSKIEPDGLAAFVARFSTVLGHTLYSMITGINGTTDVNITFEQADQILCCFLETTSCEFFSRIAGSPLEKVPFDYYISVAQGSSQMTTLSKDALAYFMGHNVSANSREECLAKREKYPYNSYLWVSSESRCLESFMNASLAVSPAFTDVDYELHEGLYSSWTESSWSVTSVRKFYKPSAKYEWLAFTIGCAVLTASFLILFWVRRNSRELFNFPHLIATSSI